VDRSQWRAVLEMCFTSLVLSGWAVRPQQALAMSPTCETSLEWRIAAAELVISGRIASVQTVSAPPGVGEQAFAWQRVRVRVQETLKGAAGAEVIFYVPDDHDLHLAFEWQKRDVAAIFCLVAGTRFSTAWRGLGYYANVPYTPVERVFYYGPAAEPASPLFLDGATETPVPTAEMRALASAEQIMAAVRRKCAQPAMSPSLACENIVVPFRAGDYAFGWPSQLIVPLNGEIKSLASGWAGSPDVRMRWNAVRVLRHVKSAENVRAMQRIAANAVDSSAGAVAKEMALYTLNRWGVAATAESTRSIPLSLSLLCLSLVAVLAAPALYLWHVSWRRKDFSRRGSWPAVRRAAAIAAVGVVVVLWLRSYVERDALAWGYWDIGCWDGEVCIVHRDRYDVKLQRALHLCRSEDLWTIRARCEDPWAYRGRSRWHIFASQMSAMQDVFPMWTRLEGYAIPFGAILATASVPAVVLSASSTWRSWQLRRGRGFDVIIAMSKAEK
jgi:hypothetical protein